MRLRLGSVATRLDAILSDAARKEPSYLAFLDSLLGEALDAKQKKRVAMGIQIAHFPVAKTLDDFDFKFQPSVDQRLVRELATGRFLTVAASPFRTRRPELKVLPVDLPMPRMPVGIVELKGRTLSPAAKLFIEHAHDVAQPLATRK